MLNLGSKTSIPCQQQNRHLEERLLVCGRGGTLAGAVEAELVRWWSQHILLCVLTVSRIVETRCTLPNRPFFRKCEVLGLRVLVSRSMSLHNAGKVTCVQAVMEW